jgi:thiosulfate reductase cytochrome b subunit
MFLSVEEVRDYAVIAYSVAGVIAFALITVFTLVLGTVSWMTLNRVRGLLKNNVQPTLESVRQTSESVRGTVEFVSDYAVSPVVKTYGTVAGARQFVAVLTRLGRSRKGG